MSAEDRFVEGTLASSRRHVAGHALRVGPDGPSSRSGNCGHVIQRAGTQECQQRRAMPRGFEHRCDGNLPPERIGDDLREQSRASQRSA